MSHNACANCQGVLWVCENHPDKPHDPEGCECGAGMPCACNPRGAIPMAEGDVMLNLITGEWT